MDNKQIKAHHIDILAELIDLTPRRIRQLRDEKIFKEAIHNHYILREAIPAYVKYLRNMIADNSLSSDYNTEKARYIKAKRENEELNLQIKQKNLHFTSDIEQIYSDMLMNFKARMLSIPSKVAKEASKMNDPNDINDLIKQNIDEALMELSSYEEKHN